MILRRQENHVLSFSRLSFGLCTAFLLASSLLMPGCQSSSQGFDADGELAEGSGDEEGQGEEPLKYAGANRAYIEEDLGSAQDSDAIKLSSDEVDTMKARVNKEEPQTAEDAEELVEDYVHSLPSTTPEHDIKQFPLVMNDRVQKWIDYFTKNDRDRYVRFMQRGAKYRKTIERIFAAQGLPKELYFLAFIESGFSNFAKSHASAVGVWQFIKPTAVRYGLRVDGHVDERSDPLRSSYAAARYLKDLFRVYQDWNLAMASYNAGEGRILRGIMRSSVRDYWHLVENGLLPKETSDYVPKIIAATLIGSNPSHYGIADVELASAWQVKALNVPGGQNLSLVASRQNIPRAALTAYNPHLRSGVVPKGRGTYRVWVPKEEGSWEAQAVEDEMLVESQTNSLNHHNKALNIVALRSGKEGAKTFVTHKVRRGETLAVIAARYKVPLQEIKQANRGRISGTRIFVNSRLRIPMVEGPTQVQAKAEPKAKESKAALASESAPSSSPDELASSDEETIEAPANAPSSRQDSSKNLDRGPSEPIASGDSQAGEELISELEESRDLGGPSVATGLMPSSGKSQGTIRHKVRRGENLQMIAQKYGITVAKLKASNRAVVSGNRIFAGTTLKVPRSGATLAASKPAIRKPALNSRTLASLDDDRVSHYRVRRGDSLEKIASRFGLSVHEIKNLNGLKRSLIFVGQLLILNN